MNYPLVISALINSIKEKFLGPLPSRTKSEKYANLKGFPM